MMGHWMPVEAMKTMPMTQIERAVDSGWSLLTMRGAWATRVSRSMIAMRTRLVESQLNRARSKRRIGPEQSAAGM